MCRASRGLSHRQPQLHPAAAVECFGQVLESQVMNRGNDGTRGEWWGSVLDVQYIHWMAPQFAGKRQGDTNEWRMRQRLLDVEVRPTLIKSFDSGPFGYV